MQTNSNAQRDLDTLTALNLDFTASVQNGDVKRFEEILADDFMMSTPNGSLLSKAEFLKLTAQPVTISGLAVEDVRIRVLGDFAIRAMIRVPDDQNYARHFLSTGYPDAQASNRSAFADRSTADRRPQRAVRRLDHFPSLDGGVRRTRADIPDKRYPFGFDTMARNRTVPVFGSASGPIRSSFAG